VDKFRVDGSRVRLAVVEVGDETGCVTLRARDNQIDTLHEVSTRSGAVVLRNCTLELYQGEHIRLAVTKWGKISSYPDNIYSTPAPPNMINYERNFSMINLSRIAGDAASSQPKDQSKTHFHYQGSNTISQANSVSHGNPSQTSNQQRRDRRPSRGSGIPSVPIHSYQESNTPPTMTPYQGQQQYAGGFVSDTVGARPYYTPQRQASVTSQQQQQQQQMMYQQHRHQYEVQQHQMQMYHPSPQLGNQQSAMQYNSTFSYHSNVAAASNFQGTYSSQGSGTTYPQTQGLSLDQHRFVPAHHQPPPDSNNNGMNAQAATFDPHASGHDSQPTPGNYPS
jgi:hypothetical protein